MTPQATKGQHLRSLEHIMTTLEPRALMRLWTLWASPPTHGGGKWGILVGGSGEQKWWGEVGRGSGAARRAFPPPRPHRNSDAALTRSVFPAHRPPRTRARKKPLAKARGSRGAEARASYCRNADGSCPPASRKGHRRWTCDAEATRRPPPWRVRLPDAPEASTRRPRA